MTKQDHLLIAQREYHFCRVRLIGMMTASERQARRLAFTIAERKLENVRQQTPNQATVTAPTPPSGGEDDSLGDGEDLRVPA